MSVLIDKKYDLYNTLLYILTALLATSFIAFNNTSLSSLSVIIITAILLGIYLLKNRGKIEIHLTAFHYLTLAFAIFCMLSSLWAVESAKNAFSDGVTIIEILICMSVLFCCYQRTQSIRGLLKAVMWSGFIIVVYSVLYYGYDFFIEMLQDSTRIENTYANANRVGMWMSITIVICTYFILNEGWKWRYLLFVFPVALLAMSQSRTAIIESIFGIILVTIFRFIDRKNILKGLLKIVIAVAVVIAVLYLVSKLEIFAAANERMEGLINLIFNNGESADSSANVRNLYIKEGFKVFLNNPILGVGIGNTGSIAKSVNDSYTYLHNNFVELLASGGIVGFVMFYSMYAYFIISLIKQIKDNVKYSEICIVLLLIMLISDWGTVSYYIKGTYLLFLICVIQIFINRHQLKPNGIIEEKHESY